MTARHTTDSVIIRAYCDDDWPAVCAVHDRARPDELRGSCDPRAFVPLADEQEDAADFQRSRKFVACIGDQIVGFVGVDGTYLSWLYADEIEGFLVDALDEAGERMEGQSVFFDRIGNPSFSCFA
jgi:hypothetical protein